MALMPMSRQRRPLFSFFRHCQCRWISSALSLPASGINNDILPNQSVKMQIIDAVRLGNTSLAKDLLKYFSSVKKADATVEFKSVLEYCSKSQEPKFALEVWKFMEKEMLDIDQRSSYHIVRALSIGGYLDEAVKILELLGERLQTTATTPIYDTFLYGCLKYGSLFHAQKCVKLMEIQHIAKSEITYMNLMKLAVREYDVAAIYQIWDEYVGLYTPKIPFYSKLIACLCRINAFEESYNVLQKMINEVKHSSEKRLFHTSVIGIPIPTRVCNKKTKYGFLDDDMRTEPNHLMNYHQSFQTETISTNRIQSSEQYTDKWHNADGKETNLEYLKYLRDSFNHVIRLAALNKKGAAAEQLYLQMINVGVKPSVHTYNWLLKAISASKGFVHGIKVVKEMQLKEIKPNKYTHALLVSGYSRIEEIDLAESVLDRLIQEGAKMARPFNALISACRWLGLLERAVRIFAKMRDAGVKPDIKTYELLYLIVGYGKRYWTNECEIFQEVVFKAISNIEMDMFANGIDHSEKSIIYLLKALEKEGMLEEMVNFLEVAQERYAGKKFSPVTAVVYNQVLDALIKANKVDVVSSVFERMRLVGVKPDVTTYNMMIRSSGAKTDYIDSAHAYVNGMLQDGHHLHSTTYYTLIKIMVKNDNIEGAMNVFKDMRDQKICPDVDTYNILLKVFGRRGALYMIEYLIENMHKAGVRPDPDTCRIVFSCYAYNGLEDTALEALQVLCVRMLSEDCNAQKKMQDKFHKIVLDEGTTVEDSLEDILRSNDFVAVALFCMRLCALCGTSPQWLPEESQWADKLRLQYDEISRNV